ncbi:MAG: hypothetical protein KDE34_20515 [Anaerolineales bacterium]|nr:hypothetical protein [Anaerolineales bacterium]
MLPLIVGKPLHVPQQVWEEYAAGIRLGRLPATSPELFNVLTLSDEETIIYNNLLARLNRGEAACLAMAGVRAGQVLTDDRDARKVAATMQIPSSGTLGILLRLWRTNHLTESEADTLLAGMLSHGYRSPITHLRQLIEL